jgi:hypothetical protein
MERRRHPVRSADQVDLPPSSRANAKRSIARHSGAPDSGEPGIYQSGATVNDYARTRRLSLNTVYTHLRRLREKTGSNRLPELIHKLNELRLPLRAE